MAAENDNLTNNESDNGISLMNLSDEDISNGSLTVTHAMYRGFEEPFTMISNQTFTQGLSVMGSFQLPFNYFSTNSWWSDRICIKYSDYQKMLSEGNSFKFEMSNIRNYIKYNEIRYYLDLDYLSSVRVYFRDVAGNYTYKQVTKPNIVLNEEFYDISFTFDGVPCDTYEIYVELIFKSFPYSEARQFIGTGTTSDKFSRLGGFNSSNLNISESDASLGLLASIIEFLQNILDGIVNLPSLIANALSSFFDMIVNAITSLGDFLIEGIKGLFVPTKDDIITIKTKWDELLEDRFGALYEVIELIDDYANSFSASEKSSINFPSISVPVAGSNFTFGGQTVKVIPDGFDILINALKLIISILATCLFINGLRNRFERVVGSE